ncbi:unnamed protein product [Rotaria sp. Silwood2]|nr:unnamed protein product [Rotaria sp. Silwood2]CAF3055589.1 unnamed protein product [Rotaria sp. Silwood2]CAF3404403.1 unnamed protein product [Rotaria sp. Silwood2]CAF4258639.1 unnamed protein product [Rotaria sp. Silwood2]CAF4283760.1 unnamed protein product [Rotaria sp. Silwood2]
MLRLSWKYQRAWRTVRHYMINMITEEQARQQQGISSNKPRNLIASLVAGADVKSFTEEATLRSTENLYKDRRSWKVDPSQFIPERFLNEDKNPSHCAFLTFGTGHRAYAGQDLAFLELRTIVKRLMQRVTFLDPSKEADNSGGFIQHITCFPKQFVVRVIID